MTIHLYWVSALTYAFVLGVILKNDKKLKIETEKLEGSFRLMANWVMFFCLQDAIWGLCDAKVIKSDTIFFISSTVFHMSTVITTFFWLNYVLDYLDDKVKNKKLYLLLDGVVIVFEFVLVAINFFKTTLFSIVDGRYVTGFLRPLTFINQYIVYLLIGIITLYLLIKNGKNADKHYRSVLVFTLAPIILGIFQLMFPDAPFYSLGYFLGCFIVHIYVVAKNREEYSIQENQLKATLELNNQLEKKQTEIDEQYEILKSISGVFDFINLLDFDKNTASRFDTKEDIVESFDIVNDPHTSLNKSISLLIDDSDYDRFWQYTDISTLAERMKGKKTLSEEFKYLDGEWIRALYIRIGDNPNEPLDLIVYALRNITSDKKREEQVYSAMTNLVYSLHIFDLENDTMERLIESDILKQIIGDEESAQSAANKIMKATSKDEYVDLMLEFVNLSTVSERVEGKKFISCEFVGRFHGWTRMSFIPIEMDETKVKKMVVTTQIIDSEKNEMINLIYKSTTDELTRIYNRRMYEEDLDAITQSGDLEDCIVVAMDVNGLKTANDTLGHKAGDELIIGASSCINKSFVSVGKTYRTGGDEFVSIIRCDEEKLKSILDGFEASVKSWTGQLNSSLSISYGCASAKEYPNLSVRELVIEADKHMYAKKAAYYSQNGIERRKRD